ELDTMYPGFLGVGTTFDIFQNILFLYLEYGVWKSLEYGVWKSPGYSVWKSPGYGIWKSPGYGILVFISSWFLVKCRHKYAVSSMMDTAYRMSEDVKKFLKKGKLEKVVAIIKSCTPNTLGDLTVTLKDLFDTISGTIHYKVLTEERFSKAITDVLSVPDQDEVSRYLHGYGILKQSDTPYWELVKRAFL
ncbi:transposase, MuDR, MULE transposase domain protein, partial [Tanacetum coccineum]